MKKEAPIRIAILDMYLGTANEGMRGIREIIEAFGKQNGWSIHYEIFDIRGKGDVPGTEFDAYISTGGPGSPIDSEGSLWEQRYFGLMEAIKRHNQLDPGNKKHVFLICHSFQVYCRYYQYGLVSKRKSTSFGVMTCHKTTEGKREPLLQALADPFWVVDSRDYQLTQPNAETIRREGGAILCIEKFRPHVDLERAVMAIRFDDAFIGTQFHPEADAAGMHMYLLQDEKRDLVVGKFGEQKYREMLEHLEDPDKIMLTHDTVLPLFLKMALEGQTHGRSLMIPSVRQAYNAAFSEEKYQSFLRDLNQLYKKEVTFRVAETPVFVPRSFESLLRKAADEIVDFLVRPDFKQLTDPAIPSGLRVPNETARSLFLALDFGVVDVDGKAEPRLIEMQGFPSLFGWQDVLSNKYREHFAVPETMKSHFGLDSVQYRSLLRRLLLDGHDPRETILLEIDPLKQNTAVDFLASQAITDIAPVHIGDLIRRGKKLYYNREGKQIEVKRIYNRVIFDELVKRTDLKLDFDLTQDVDVSWAGHPNWFFRISKYTMPMIRSRFIPECRFLSEYTAYPPDLENYVLKPLFSFSGSGVIFHVKPEDLRRIPEAERAQFMLQRKVNYLPVIQAPDGMVKAEIRLLFLWEEDQPRPQLVTNLARLSRGEMIGVKYNKDKTWVGGSVCFFEG